MKDKKISPLSEEIKTDLRIILDYLIENEEIHFLENDKPKNHIYNNALRVNKWLKGKEENKPYIYSGWSESKIITDEDLKKAGENLSKVAKGELK